MPPMGLTALLTSDNIVLNMPAKDKWEAIKILARAAASGVKLSKQQLFECIEALNRRENVSSTYVGNNIALPHTTIDSISNPLISLGVCREGIRFDDAADSLAKIIVVLMVPRESLKTHAVTLAQVARIFTKPEVRDAIICSLNSREVLDIIKKAET